jgi:hypothetical protein
MAYIKLIFLKLWRSLTKKIFSKEETRRKELLTSENEETTTTEALWLSTAECYKGCVKRSK